MVIVTEPTEHVQIVSVDTRGVLSSRSVKLWHFGPLVSADLVVLAIWVRRHSQSWTEHARLVASSQKDSRVLVVCQGWKVIVSERLSSSCSHIVVTDQSASVLEPCTSHLTLPVAR